MADTQGTMTHDSGMDYPEHERTYKLFTTIVKWATAIIAIILILMAIFLL